MTTEAQSAAEPRQVTECCGLDQWGSPSPTPLPKQGHPDLVGVGFEYLQRRRIHHPSGQPAPALTLRAKKFFLVFSWSFLCFSFCPLPLVLSLATALESGLVLPTPTLQIFISIFMGSLLSLLFSRLNKPSSFSLSS